MNPTLGYLFAKIISKLRHEKNKETINKWFIKQGVNLVGGGEGTHINSNIAINEPHLITIGVGTTIAGNVEFVTHDNSISKVIPNTTDLFGRIIIGNNCFIGAKSVILYGVTIPDDVIVAAGSVVTKSIEQSRVIVAGNPAKIISTWEKFAKKSEQYAWNMDETTRKTMIQKTSCGERLVNR